MLPCVAFKLSSTLIAFLFFDLLFLRLLKCLHEEVAKSDVKVTRKVDEVNNEMHREVTKINTVLKDINLREKERERQQGKK